MVWVCGIRGWDVRLVVQTQKQVNEWISCDPKFNYAVPVAFHRRGRRLVQRKRKRS